jgi:exopolyphosphatase/guanosine-5'-triphosphate,3'-diphosphate pyrophosphatase
VSPDLTALVDLGSNSVRLMLVRIVPGAGYRVVRDERAQTRLGSSGDGLLAPEAIARTVDAVVRFLRATGRFGPMRVLAIATAAVRDAANAAELLDRLRLEAEIEVEVLSTDQEARLGALAARASLQLREATVVDLGGCSLQISRISDAEPIAVGSVPLGAVRTTERFLAHDPPTDEELAALRHAVRSGVAGLLPKAGPGESLVGIGGSARALERLATWGASKGSPNPPAARRAPGSPGRSSIPVQRLRIAREELAALRARLAGLTLSDRRQLPGLKPSRADVIVAGAVVLEELLGQGDYPSLLVAEHGVRHGVLLRETFETGSPRTAEPPAPRRAAARDTTERVAT